MDASSLILFSATRSATLSAELSSGLARAFALCPALISTVSMRVRYPTKKSTSVTSMAVTYVTNVDVLACRDSDVGTAMA